MFWVIKNQKTGEYSDGKFGWTLKLAEACRYGGDDSPPKSHDHIGFVPYEKELKK